MTRRHLDFVNRYDDFVKVKGRGLIPMGEGISHQLHHHINKMTLGRGTPAHKKDDSSDEEMGGRLIHPHKHSTRETHKSKSYTPLKFNY